jgi:hypothetical protein
LVDREMPIRIEQLTRYFGDLMRDEVKARLFPLVARIRMLPGFESFGRPRPRKISAPPTKFLIACAPKSGSTYLTTLIGNLPNFSVTSYAPAGGRREQELSEALMRKGRRSSRQVAQHHIRASDYTLGLIQKFDVTPLILVRNIYDAALSFAEHMVNESPIAPMAYFDDTFARSSLEHRLNAFIDLAAPWYFNFYVSWWHYRPKAIVTYEDIILGGPNRQSEFLQSIGIATNLEEVLLAREKAKSQFTRFNIGKAGRGAAILDFRTREKLSRLASYYPNVDFSPIGLPGNVSEGKLQRSRHRA